MNNNQNDDVAAKLDRLEQRHLFQQQELLIREEGRKTRSSIWLAIFVVLGVVLLAPVILMALPLVAGGLGLAFLAAVAGALIAKTINKRREQKIMQEIFVEPLNVVEPDFMRDHSAERRVNSDS